MTDKAEKSGRRNFLKILGGGVILAAGAGGIFAGTRTPTKAIEPWKLALGPDAGVDPRRIILSHAILAPNPHNRQPWVVDLETENEITLYCDLDKRLPHTDPYDRQITIGFGCFLELLVLTAKEIGIRTDVTLFPEGENLPRLDQRAIARIKLVKDDKIQRDPLFAQITERRTNKDELDITKSVAQKDFDTIIGSAKHDTLQGEINDLFRIETMRKLTWDALEKEIRTYRTAKESVDLMRVGKTEIEANPDGIDLGGVFFESLSLVGVLDPEAMLDESSAMFTQSVAALKPSLLSAMGYVFVKTKGNTRKDQIAAGRDYVRFNLKATELGLEMRPISQALQEYPEVESYYHAVRNDLGIADSETLQMLALIGYGEKPEPSPRWNYEAKIRSS